MNEIPSSDAIVVGRKLPTGFDETCDVVIVGSGAGGSVMAAITRTPAFRAVSRAALRLTLKSHRRNVSGSSNRRT